MTGQLQTKEVLKQLEAAKNEIRKLFAAHRGALDELQRGCTHPVVFVFSEFRGRVSTMVYHICPGCGAENVEDIFWRGQAPHERPFATSLKYRLSHSNEFLAIRKRFAPLVAEVEVA